MKLGDEVKQLTDLIVDLVPTVDRLAQNQELLIETTKQNSEAIHQMVGQVEKLAITSTKTNLEISEIGFVISISFPSDAVVLIIKLQLNHIYIYIYNYKIILISYHIQEKN